MHTLPWMCAMVLYVMTDRNSVRQTARHTLSRLPNYTLTLNTRTCITQQLHVRFTPNFYTLQH